MKSYITLNNELMQKVDGFYQLEKDKQAVKEFQAEVDERLMRFNSVIERFEWLIKNNYYVDFFKLYNKDSIVDITAEVYSYQFKFQSFMAISKFYQSYALKTNDKKQYLETYEDRIVACALYLAQGDAKIAKDLAITMIRQEYQPATPTFQNAGKSRGGEMISCFLLSCDDSLNSINHTISTCGQLSKIGGGVAVDLTRLRGRGEAIKEVDGCASGVMPVMKLMEDTFSYVNQLGTRPGAGVAYLNIFHWDIEELLGSKKINADEKSRLQTLSIGVIVPDKFIELAKDNKPMYVFAPHTVYKEYGEHLDTLDIDKVYEDLVANPNVRKRQLNPRNLLTNIARTQFESGYPYLVYKTNANKAHPLRNIGQIKMSNLCVTGDTRLHTTEGLVTARELYKRGNDLRVVVDNRTINHNKNECGTSVVNAIPMQLTAKQANVYEVTTQQGYTIKATEWHKFYREVGGKIEKVALHELNIGDKLLVQSEKGAHGTFDNKELAYIAGLINGDGTITDKTAKIYLYGEKAILKEEIERICAVLIKEYAKRSYKHNASFEPKFVYDAKQNKWTLSSAILFDVLKDFGVTKENKTRVPEFVFQGTEEVVGAFLSGLYQMDGTVNSSVKYKAMSYELASIDEQGVKEIQMLLINQGIYSTIYPTDKKVSLLPDGKGGKKEYATKPLFKICIQDRKSREKFNEIVTLKEKDEQKIEEFNKCLKPISRKPKHNYTTVITDISFCGVEDVYDTTQPDYHSLIFNGIVTGNCTEIFQLQETSIINDYGVEDEIKRDIACNLGSLNIANVMENGDIGKAVHTGMRALTQVSDLSDIANAPSIAKANRELHAVGLGAMNLHGYLAKNKISYESKEARDFVRTFFMIVNYYSIQASMQIATEKDAVFKDFEQSDYASGYYFKKYLETDYSPKTKKVQKLFADMFVPTPADWEELMKEVQENGLYHAYRLAIAPTQSIGYVQNATPSIAPITDIVERRTYGDSTTYYPMPYLSKQNFFFYKSAYEMDMTKMIDLVAEAQNHIDQGISTVLYVDSNTSTRELAKLYLYAHHKGLKSLYYTRNRNLTITECSSCSV